MGCAQLKKINSSEKYIDDHGDPIITRNKLISLDGRMISHQPSCQIHQNTKIRQKLTEEEIQKGMEILKQHELFSSLDETDLRALTEKMVIGTTQKNQYLFKQNDMGTSFFIILQGRVDVVKNEKTLKSLSAGQTFGQIALMLRCKRTTSIYCTGQINTFLIIKSYDFRKTLEEIKSNEYQKNVDIVNKVQIFTFLNTKEKYNLAQNIKKIKFTKGSEIFAAGDVSQSFYVILRGKVRVKIPLKNDKILQAYESFGESSLIEGRKRSGTVIAQVDCTCAIFLRTEIEKSVQSEISNIIYYNQKKWAFMNSSKFQTYDQKILNEIILSCSIQEAKEGEIIMNGYPEAMYIPLQGTINDIAEGTIIFDEYWPFFQKTKKTVLKKDQAGFYATLPFKTMNDVLKKTKQKKVLDHRTSKKKESLKIRLGVQKILRFEHLRELGHGQFGTVYMIRDANNKSAAYALKCIKKSLVKKEGMESSVRQEKQILQSLTFPLICGYVEAFEDINNIYLVLEYIKGQEMFDVIRQIGFLSQDIIKFYFGSLLLCMQHLHSRNIVYRDLKPENSIVNYTGKVILVDLGTAKILAPQKSFKTFTIIGTPHYMAPETFSGEGYSFEVDLWALGVLLYELAFGILPFGHKFDGSDPFEVFMDIKKKPLSFDQKFKNEELEEVASALLVKDPKERVISGNLSKIKKMKYFFGYNWDQLQVGSIRPPYIPKKFINKVPEIVFHMQGTPLFPSIYKSNSLDLQSLKLKYWSGKF